MKKLKHKPSEIRAMTNEQLLTLLLEADWYAKEHYDSKVRADWKVLSVLARTEVLQRMKVR